MCNSNDSASYYFLPRQSVISTFFFFTNKLNVLLFILEQKQTKNFQWLQREFCFLNSVDFDDEMFSRADIGLIGLAVMGQNLILNMNDNGFTVNNFE